MTERAKNVQPDIAAFFGVELAALDVAGLNRRGKLRAVFSGGDNAVGAVGCIVGVDEINAVALVYKAEKRAFFDEFERIPADVRNL